MLISKPIMQTFIGDFCASTDFAVSYCKCCFTKPIVMYFIFAWLILGTISVYTLQLKLHLCVVSDLSLVMYFNSAVSKEVLRDWNIVHTCSTIFTLVEWFENFHCYLLTFHRFDWSSESNHLMVHSNVTT